MNTPETDGRLRQKKPLHLLAEIRLTGVADVSGYDQVIIAHGLRNYVLNCIEWPTSFAEQTMHVWMSCAFALHSCEIPANLRGQAHPDSTGLDLP